MARSQNLHLCRKISSDCTHQLEISDSSRASTPEKICLHQFFNLLQLLAGDLPLKRSLKGIYDLQSKDLPMLRRDVHVWPAAPSAAAPAAWRTGARGGRSSLPPLVRGGRGAVALAIAVGVASWFAASPQGLCGTGCTPLLCPPLPHARLTERDSPPFGCRFDPVFSSIAAHSHL